MIQIYGLYDPEGKLRYIGQALDAIGRLKSHWRFRAEGHSRKDTWLQSLDNPPLIRILVIVEDREAYKVERFAIEEACTLFGYQLTNDTFRPRDGLWGDSASERHRLRYPGYWDQIVE